jgi:uncharacterized protein YlxP (DUF503 family)
MPVGLLTLELHIADAQSLKDKRQVLRSLKDRLRAHFNVAVAELDFEDTWQRSVVGVVTLSNEEHHVEEALQFFEEPQGISSQLVIPGYRLKAYSLWLKTYDLRPIARRQHQIPKRSRGKARK